MSNTCPACTSSLGRSEPLCSRCWERLPAELQQNIAYAHGLPAPHAVAMAAALAALHTRADHRAALREAAAHRSKARR